ncbi:methyltransferase family protein [Polyangium fumosum]|uniref:Isoprenylcysteine carboxylmethyltransferase family protein n=1 Tax=Polyangium fumosum TaxID=889272 RepID=A0A4U1JG77_9BACT|nr:isoprenylcysteine carboxylmethyltransferase family protein [Polyangium fumosum]TKD10327.1 isoprenylcysteine carboxylmethyltransferase family protein [Polyangium fumosum]
MQPALVALVIFVVYMAVAFGIRTVQHLRATGTTGFQGISGPPGSASWFGGVLFALALGLAALAPVLELAGLVKSLVELPRWATWSAAGLAVVGTVATYGSQVAMGKSWRIGVRDTERTELVIEGPFRIVRNPIFSCMLVTGTEIALVLPNVLALVSLLCLFVAVELQVRVVEEPYLHRTHGPRYAEYCLQVGRFVPGLGRRRF